MRVLTVLVAILFLGTAASSAVAPPALVPALDPVLRSDPDGGRTVVALLEDGIGGAYRYVPITDEGLAAFTNATEGNNVFVDPIVYQANLKEVGAFAHSFVLEGTPYLTLGAYVVTTDAGMVRMPVVMLENVNDLQGAALLLASVFGDDAMPRVAEAIPHAYGLAAPDSAPVVLVGAIAIILVGLAPLLAVGVVQGTDAAHQTFNLPPELYVALNSMGVDAFLLVIPLLVGPHGLPGHPGSAAPYAEDWVDRPEVRIWTVHKSGAGHDLWKGTYVKRTGSSNGGTSDAFEGTKRVETGLAVRLDGAVTHVAGVYEQTDVSRHAGNGALASTVRYTVGATAADAADAPLVSLEMEQARADGLGNLYLFPQSQQEEWRVGVRAGETFVPLLGARTSTTHHIHPDVDNQGQPLTEIETERITSVGAYAAGGYVPLVGARYWGERNPTELYALMFVGGGLLGDQLGGDVEVSAGTFALGAYVPVVGARIDDDFPLHLYTYRSMVSAGTYALSAFVPVLGTTYDGERPLFAWATGHASGASDGDARWRSSVGAFALGTYRPVFGSRFEPSTHGAERAQQESYQFGVYPLSYATFVPLVGVEYDGDQASLVWAAALHAGAQGAPREQDADVDVLTFAPGGARVPLAGVQYRASAPDQHGAYDTHVALGVYQGTTFTPLVGATVSADADPQSTLLAQTEGDREARLSVGHYVGGSYVPLGTIDTAVLPAPPSG